MSCAKYSFLFLIFLPFLSFSQTKFELFGNWKVYQVKLSEDFPFEAEGMAKEEIEAFKQSFVNAVFEFTADGRMSFLTNIPDIDIKGGHWKYDAANSYISINEWEDRNLSKAGLMGIYVSKDRMGRMLFHLDESPFIFIMDKTK